MNETAAEFEPDVDEFQAAGLTPIHSQLIRPYRVQESGIQMECVLHDILHFGDQPGAGSFVIGKVVLMHISDELYADGKIDMEKLLPIGRMAGHVYTRAVSDTFMLERKSSGIRKAGGSMKFVTFDTGTGTPRSGWLRRAASSTCRPSAKAGCLENCWNWCALTRIIWRRSSESTAALALIRSRCSRMQASILSEMSPCSRRFRSRRASAISTPSKRM